MMPEELMKALDELEKAKQRETVATSDLGKLFLQWQKTCAAYQKIYIENMKLRNKLVECGQFEFVDGLDKYGYLS